jgi:hypothetical protein
MIIRIFAARCYVAISQMSSNSVKSCLSAHSLYVLLLADSSDRGPIAWQKRA